MTTASRIARVLTIVAFLGCCVVGWSFGKDDLRRLVEDWGIAAPMLSVPIHAMIAATPLPSDVITIANGAVYGYVPAVMLSWLGWYLGSILEFHTVRTATRIDPTRSAGMAARMPAWLRRWPVASPWFLILGRQIPWGGAHLTIIPAAAGGVSWGRFLWCSAIAIVPGALLLPAIGAKMLG